MNQYNCDIIKDLIPSYLEDICSESSKQAVDEHLRECADCRRHLELLRTTEFTAHKAEQGPLDFMRKTKKYYARKSALSLILLLLLAFIFMLFAPVLRPSSSIALYCAEFAILSMGVFLLLSNYQAKPPKSLTRTLLTVASCLGLPYCAILVLLFRHIAASWTGLSNLEPSQTGPFLERLFNLEPSQTGPFLERQFLLIILVELLILTYHVLDSVRKEHSPGFLPLLNLAICTLCLSYRSLLYYMDTYDTALKMTWIIGLQVTLAVTAITLLQLALSRWLNRHDKE